MFDIVDFDKFCNNQINGRSCLESTNSQYLPVTHPRGLNKGVKSARNANVLLKEVGGVDGKHASTSRVVGNIIAL